MASSEEVFCWVDKDDINGVAIGGVTRDCSPEGRRIYVIRASYDTGNVVGNYEEGNGYAEFERFGIQSSMDWEFLVSNGEVAGKVICIPGWGAASYSSLSITEAKICSRSYLSRCWLLLNCYINLKRKQRFTMIMDLSQVKLSHNENIQLSKFSLEQYSSLSKKQHPTQG